jgi:metal-dependent HD superfamily phosphatase/phosphodiesterase
MKPSQVKEELHSLLKRYPRAEKYFRRVEEDEEVEKLQDLANNMLINRLGYTDHGRVHGYIVARNGLKVLEVLLEAGMVPNLVKEDLGDMDDVATVLTISGFLHDIGNSIHRAQHGIHSMILALPILQRHLRDHPRKEVIITSVLEAIYAHNEGQAISLEASILKVADGMDMEEGRARIPYEMGRFDIHAVSALSIKHVDVERGKERPLRIVVDMEHTAGLFQVEKVLGEKIKTSALRGKVEVLMRIPSVGEKILYF